MDGVENLKDDKAYIFFGKMSRLRQGMPFHGQLINQI
jgi:hypothetical protein